MSATTFNRAARGARKWGLILTAACTFAGTAAAGEIASDAGQPFIVDRTATSIEWLPKLIDTSYKLTVSGPGGVYVERQFEPGEVPQITLDDLKSMRNNFKLGGGTYFWEISQIKPASANELGDPLAEENMVSASKVVESVGTVSGSFQVQSGELLVPRNIPESTTITKGTVGLKADTAEQTFNRICTGNNCASTPETYPSILGAEPDIMQKATANRFLFMDTSNSNDFPTRDWAFIANDQADGGANYFVIQDRGDEGSLNLRPFRVDAGSLSDTLRLQAGSEIDFCTIEFGCVFTNDYRLGIGTATPGTELHVKASNASATLRLEGETGAFFDQAVGGSGLFFSSSQTSGSAVEFWHDAPTDSLVVRNAGIGIGTSSPSAPLHVQRSSGARILVENTSDTVAERVPFKLVNNGKTRFEIANGTDSWTFDNAGTQFNISFVGTGLNEFIVENDGDGRFRGRSFATDHVNTSSRAAKTNFTPVDEQTILEKVAALEVTQWHYKQDDATKPHVGPVAEDFQAIFGLGDGAHISTVDIGGVALAAIKGLKKENEAKEAKINELEERLRRLEAVVNEGK